MNVSVIIPTYNRADSLERTLRYLLNSEGLPVEIILVDQTTDADLARKIERLSALSPIIRLVHNDVPSLTMARNTGLEVARGEVVVFMDDDVDVGPMVIGEIDRLFSQDRQLAMIAGINKGEEYIRRNSLLGVVFGRSSFSKRYQGHVTKAVYGRFPVKMSAPVDTEWAMGFFFAVRKALVDKYNLRFDEHLRYYAYAEDLDFSYRLYKSALRERMTCRMFPEIVVRHNVSTEYRIPQRKAVFQTVIHRRYLSYKLFGTWRSRVACVWSDIGSVLMSCLRRENWRDIRDAMRFCSKYANDVKVGNFHYEEFV